MKQFNLLNGDCLELLKTLPDNSIDAVVTDPPYGLAFMGKKWDYDVPSVEVWREVLRVLKPGGHLLSFGGTRTYHRLVVAIEDAGFEIRDQLQWIYGSGFPKSLDISKAIDKAAGAEREVVGSKLGMPGYHLSGHDGGEAFGHGLSSSTPETRAKSATITAPATEDAKRWQGWGTALKPANEPICLARKPLIGTVAQNVLEHGTGGLNIDASRIDGRERTNYGLAKAKRCNGAVYGKDGSSADFDASQGRFPANVLFYEDAAAVLDAQTDEKQPTSRFFYVAKASKKDRGEGNVHPTVKPTALMEYLVRMVTPEGGTVLDPFMGSGTTGVAAVKLGFNFIGCELDPGYLEIARARIEVRTREPRKKVENE